MLGCLAQAVLLITLLYAGMSGIRKAFVIRYVHPGYIRRRDTDLMYPLGRVPTLLVQALPGGVGLFTRRLTVPLYLLGV